MKGYLFIHGFTGSKDDFNFLVPSIKSNNIVKCITLKGHEKLKLRKVSYKDWLNDAITAYEELEKECDEIIVIGHSMGCVIASNLSIIPNNKIIKSIYLNPAFKHTNNFEFVLYLPFILAEAPFSLLRDKRPLRSLKRMFTPGSAVKQLRQICSMSLDNIPLVKEDTLIIHGKRDRLVKPSYGEYVHTNISHSNKKIVWLKYWHNPYAASKKVRKEIINEVLEFIDKK